MPSTSQLQQTSAILNSFKVKDQVKILKMWLETKDIKCASNKKQRKVAKSWSGVDLVVCNAPFNFLLKDSSDSFEVKNAPWGYIKDLPSHIINKLNLLKKKNLLQHSNIKNGEIHIKIGNDYGGGSFNMCYQIVNVDRPNARRNTDVFSIFEAKEYKPNLIVVLSMFTQQINQLQSLCWNEKKIRVFIFGDYKFLCSAYGVTGANGRHACLFCHITRAEMKKPDAQQISNCSSRTLETLNADLQKFIQKGQIPRFAKYCNNVIDSPLFNIPLTQVGIPSLHISLGIYLKFFNMLEDGCHLIDIKIAAKMCLKNKTVNNKSFDEYIALQLKYMNKKKLFLNIVKK
ncbi:uncharacterized protein LOC136082931 [Hydra vulgaris]|uniref:Uncharacterized protein LOC136082931 n=1 Tax=Hydra vulgaris TaxID=6087 RepID=A0ABM4C9U3_HYDVU